MRGIAALLTIVVIAVSGCSSTTPLATPGAMSVSPGGAAGPTTPTDRPSPWHVVLETPEPTDVFQVGFLDTRFGMAIGQIGEISRTSDGGATWQRAVTPFECRFGLDIVTENVVWHCGNGRVGLSTDGGRTWGTAGSLSTTADMCKFISFLDDRTGWLATSSELHSTGDAGTTWEQPGLPALTADIAAIQLRTASDGYVLDRSGKLWVTVDGGSTWTSRSLGLIAGQTIESSDASLAAIHFSDASHGLVVARLTTSAVPSAVAMHTSDGGATWTSESLPLDPHGLDSLYLAADGMTLTFAQGRKITLLRYQP